MQLKDVKPELRDELAVLPAGEVSEVVLTDVSLYLIKMDARRQSGSKSFEETRALIKKDLKAKESARLKARWIAHLKATNYVVIYDEK